MVVVVTRDVGGVLLVLIGGAILRISVGDVYLRYVKESLRPWLLASGAILVLLGLLTLLDVWRASRAAPATADAGDATADAATPDDAVAGATDHLHHDADDEHGLDEHGHAHGAPRAAWLLLLPVLAIFLVAPPALGAYSAERETAVVTAPAADSDVPPLPPGDPVPVYLSDYASRAVWDDGRSLVGRNVELTGFVSKAPDGGWYLTRLSLTCCAADAVATKIVVKDAPYAPPNNTWITVVGQWVPGGGTQSETAIPWVKATTMAEVPVPKNPYE
ncbi:MAG: TIGR03943 family protein [Candidatus Nanopelagicales bacterium]